MKKATRKIRLELGRTKEYPNGNPTCAYEFYAPLDDTGHIDLAAYKELHTQCRVRRFWEGERIKEGALLHLGPDRWVFSYEAGREDDEKVYKLDRHSFRVGDYVSLTEQDGAVYPFKIVQVE